MTGGSITKPPMDAVLWPSVPLLHASGATPAAQFLHGSTPGHIGVVLESGCCAESSTCLAVPSAVLEEGRLQHAKARN